MTDSLSPATGAAFARRLERAVRDAERREDDAVQSMRRLLRELRGAIASELVDASASRTVSLQRLLAALDGAVSTFTASGAAEVADAERDTWRIAQDAMPPALRAAKIAVVLPAASTDQLAVLTAYSTDLIRGLAQDVRGKVASVIRQAAAGILSPQEAMRRVGGTIDRGAFKSAAARAEAIIRTEVLRTYSIATDARMDQAETAGVLLRRTWNATRDKRTRADHAAAHGQIRNQQGYYLVGGERLRYPRDPRASARQTIRCRCVETAEVMGVRT